MITRLQALKQGLPHYFTNKPCSRGHIDFRFVSSRHCVTCSADRVKADRKSNPKYHCRLSQVHRTKLRLKALHSLGNKCVRCGTSDFRVLQIDHIFGDGLKERKKYGDYGSAIYSRVLNDRRRNSSYQLLCANCNTEKSCKENHSNFNSKSGWRKLRNKVLEYFGPVCNTCGCNNLLCLQLDHRNGGGRQELKQLGRYQSHKRSLERPDEYQILCANCNWIKRYTNQEVTHANL